jgi:ATP-dependent RNA helicase DeaD
MALAEHADLLGPELLSAIERKGYTDLTQVQRVVLDPKLDGQDLRITSQTGSGKTLAIGLSLRGWLGDDTSAVSGVARPRALLVAPTRELALQVERELAWLYANSGARVASATGGASYRAEQRALAQGPFVVVGTPGRLLDHLKRGSIDPKQVCAVVLDEADRMLELGFREDLEAIFEYVPKERTTHLVSATFPRALRSMADSVQRQPRHVEGSVLGVANTDIDHVIHIVESHARLDAIVNLLLANPEDQTLVFVRTRADVARLTSELVAAGLSANGLSGEMDQAARNRALAGFRKGTLRAMIATDVAARGIDVQSVSRVIHAELPRDPDAYTHRSGRTGRAGRKGTSALLVPPAGVVIATRLLRGLGITHRFEPIPTPEQIHSAHDERVFEALTVVDETAEPAIENPRMLALAQRLTATGSVEQILMRLLADRMASVQPRVVQNFSERVPRERGGQPRAAQRTDRRPNGPSGEKRVFMPFRVSWGGQRGADARRLLAMLCRRGDIRGTDVGAIRVEPTFSIVGVASDVADAFERAASQPDPREPAIQIRRYVERQAPDRSAEPNGPKQPRAPFKARRPKPFQARAR